MRNRSLGSSPRLAELRLAQAIEKRNVMTQHPPVSPVEQARLVIGVTRQAWRVAPLSEHAEARRAPHGYVPLRALRRVQVAAQRRLPVGGALAHSW